MIETWSNGTDIIHLKWSPNLEWAYKIKLPDVTTQWIAGISYYWLMQNGYKRV